MQKVLGLSDLIRLLSSELPPTTGQALAEFLENQPELFVGGCQMKCGALEMLSNQAAKTQSNGVPSSTYEWLSNAAAWFYTQNVASFDSDFANVLVKTSFDKDFDLNCIKRFEGNPIYIPLEKPCECKLGSHASFSKDTGTFLGVVVSVESTSQNWATMIYFNFLLISKFVDRDNTDWAISNFLVATRDGESFSIDKFLQSFKTFVLDDEGVAKEIIEKLVYLLSDEPEAIEWRHEVLDFVPQIRKHKRRASTIYAPRQPRVKRFGEAFGNEIRQASAAMGTDRSVKPHIRSAHWHTYLVGEGRSKRVIRWLKPIFVHSRQADPASTRIPAY